jgi:hypothetical protein
LTLRGKPLIEGIPELAGQAFIEVRAAQELARLLASTQAIDLVPLLFSPFARDELARGSRRASVWGCMFRNELSMLKP